MNPKPHTVEIHFAPLQSLLALAARCGSSSVADMNLLCRGYVALAVATEKDTSTKEVETGLGGDREGNMVAFALESLRLLKDVIKGNAKL